MKNHIQTMADHWLRPLICLLIVMSTQVHGSHLIDITLLKSAVSKGAVCLDGSPPAYYFQKGSGDGANNWLVYLEGGGWCASHDGCEQRTRTIVGSSSLRKGATFFGQIMSSDQTINPDFYNWNIVSVVYCDGSSYMGDVEGAILSGGSAGGLGANLHCDGFGALLPSASRVKCISDSGFFIHAVRDIQTPYFFLESAFDDHQTLREVANSKSTGIFIHSCYRHGHFYDKESWANSPVLGDKTIVKAIGDWYFERSSVQEIDTQNELPQNCTNHA
ncbi:UNVERIFIED_CONTAM: Pectin acetylesterase 8 [Sesamum angustifolium]|uniref:Pectin acetylesterase n=1 Tax=Sesamum angustifolium TaxID=2727405 RepID=A0AAW2LUV4_9LAMI